MIPAEGLGGSFGIVRPISGCTGLDRITCRVRNRLPVRFNVYQTDRVIGAFTKKNDEVALNCHGKDGKSVVIGVVSNQIHSSRSPDLVSGWVRPELLAKYLPEGLLSRCLLFHNKRLEI